MKREILFRGKQVDIKGWVYGNLVICDDGKNFIVSGSDNSFNWYEVIPETVGQFTGLIGKNSVKIFEGDKLIFRAITCDYIPKDCYSAYGKGQLFVVTKLNSGFTLTDPKILGSEIPNQVGHVDNYTFWNHQGSFEIIGNIHDNLQLIKA